MPVPPRRRPVPGHAAAIRELIAATAPDVTTLLCVGHNPAMADLAEEAIGQPVEFPTPPSRSPRGPGRGRRRRRPGDLAAFWTPKLGASGAAPPAPGA